MKTEAQLRRAAKKQGYALKKSHSGYSVDNLGGFMIINLNTNAIVAGEHFEMSLEDAERFLVEE